MALYAVVVGQETAASVPRTNEASDHVPFWVSCVSGKGLHRNQDRTYAGNC